MPPILELNVLKISSLYETQLHVLKQYELNKFGKLFSAFLNLKKYSAASAVHSSLDIFFSQSECLHNEIHV